MNDLRINRILAVVALIIACLSFVVDGPLIAVALILLCIAVLVG